MVEAKKKASKAKTGKSKKDASETSKPVQKRKRRRKEPVDAPFADGMTEQEMLQKALALLAPGGLPKRQLHSLSDGSLGYEISKDVLFYGLVLEGNAGESKQHAIAADIAARKPKKVLFLTKTLTSPAHYASSVMEFDKDGASLYYMDPMPSGDDQERPQQAQMGGVEVHYATLKDRYGYPLSEQASVMQSPSNDLLQFVTRLAKEAA